MTEWFTLFGAEYSVNANRDLQDFEENPNPLFKL